VADSALDVGTDARSGLHRAFHSSRKGYPSHFEITWPFQLQEKADIMLLMSESIWQCYNDSPNFLAMTESDINPSRYVTGDSGVVLERMKS
jgi:hypothetical protein